MARFFLLFIFSSYIFAKTDTGLLDRLVVSVKRSGQAAVLFSQSKVEVYFFLRGVISPDFRPKATALLQPEGWSEALMLFADDMEVYLETLRWKNYSEKIKIGEQCYQIEQALAKDPGLKRQWKNLGGDLILCQQVVRWIMHVDAFKRRKDTPKFSTYKVEFYRDATTYKPRVPLKFY